MTAARGAEESTEWRQPDDLIALCEAAATELAELLAQDPGAGGWSEHAALARDMLRDNSAGIVEAIKTAIRQGAAPTDHGQSVAYAAALRVARFGDANEHADWETAHHIFTYANALHRMLERIGAAGVDRLAAARGLLHGAAALYLTRYLNVPPARIPGEDGERLDDLRARRRSAPPCSTHSTGSDRSISRRGSWRGISRLGIRRRR